MNILPLVFSFLIIFSCLCFTFFKEVKSLALIEMTLEGYNHTEKAVRNAVIRRAYDKIKDDSPPGSPKKEETQKAKNFGSKRLQFPPLDTSKFYLRALTQVQMESSQHPLYEPLAELLRLLYKKSVFDKYPKLENLEYRLVEALLKKAQKFPSEKELCHLYPDDPELQKIYYKMLKGTNYYTEEAGIPPLAHFISLEKGDKAAYLGLASPPVLKALFGEKITQQILQIEKEKSQAAQKQHTLSKEELEALLLKEPGTGSVLAAIQPYLNYSKQLAKRKSLARRDKFTRIGIEKDL